MSNFPTQPLDPRVKSVWRISDAIWITIVMACIILPLLFVALFAEIGPIGWILVGISVAIYALLMIIFLVVLPPIRYMRWRYEVTPEFLDIARGIIWRKRFVIPFIRVQNTDTHQGPILRAFGLASVTVSTAAGEHEIPGLELQTAELLRDRAAELARIAREDV